MNSTPKVIAAGMIGNVLEWYDFAIYGYFAVAIGRHFFPHGARAAGIYRRVWKKSQTSLPHRARQAASIEMEVPMQTTFDQNSAVSGGRQGRENAIAGDDLFVADLLGRLMAAESRAAEQERLVAGLCAILSAQGRMIGGLQARLLDKDGHHER